jgi:hypothetical protein
VVIHQHRPDRRKVYFAPGLDLLKIAFVTTVVFFSSTLPPATRAQDTVTGAFEGTISDVKPAALSSALVEIINQQTNVVIGCGRTIEGVSTGAFASRHLSNSVSAQAIELTVLAFENHLHRRVVPVPVALDPAPQVW